MTLIQSAENSPLCIFPFFFPFSFFLTPSLPPREVKTERQRGRKEREKRKRGGGRQRSHFITEWPGNVRDEEQEFLQDTHTHTHLFSPTHTKRNLDTLTHFLSDTFMNTHTHTFQGETALQVVLLLSCKRTFAFEVSEAKSKGSYAGKLYYISCERRPHMATRGNCGRMSSPRHDVSKLKLCSNIVQYGLI